MKPLVDGSFKIQKMDMKGGWAYVTLPIKPTKTNKPFGWNIVKGSIDSFKIKQYKLWPTAAGNLFLPIKASIRKSISKQVGDNVHIVLFKDNSALIIPEEFLLCLQDDPIAFAYFNSISETSKKQYIDYVYGTKNLDIRAKRIVNALQKLALQKKWHEK